MAVQFRARLPSGAHTTSSPSTGNRRSSGPPPPPLPQGSALLPASRRQSFPRQGSARSYFLLPASLNSGSFPPLASLVFSPPYIFSTPLPFSLATLLFSPLFIEDFFLRCLVFLTFVHFSPED